MGTGLQNIYILATWLHALEKNLHLFTTRYHSTLHGWVPHQIFGGGETEVQLAGNNRLSCKRQYVGLVTPVTVLLKTLGSAFVYCKKTDPNCSVMVYIVMSAVALSLAAWLQSSLPFISWFGPKASVPQDLLSISSHHQYTVQMLSTDPVMVYLGGFIHPRESPYLLELGYVRMISPFIYPPFPDIEAAHAVFRLTFPSSQPLFEPSRVYTHSEEKQTLPPSYRTSSSCVLPGTDPIDSLVKLRALSLLGFVPYTDVEALQLVRYRPSELFGMHYDWFNDPLVDKNSGERYNRVASFFLYLDANCTSGGTYFSRLPAPPEGRSEDRFSTTANRPGLVIVPRLGSGVAWLNLNGTGAEDERTLHAGLPVREGSKVGMNIWIKMKV